MFIFDNNNVREYRYMAGETLPTTGVAAGSQALCIGKLDGYSGTDKVGDIYFFDGAQWNKAGA